MNDYMRALHQRFYQEPDFSELEEDIENTRQEVRDFLDKLQRRRLMHLSLIHIWKAVDGLDDQSQDLIRLRYGSDLTMEEIGKIYGVSKMAVSKRLKKLHEKLRSSVT